MFRFNNFSRVIAAGCSVWMLGTPILLAEPDLTVQTQMQTGHRLAVHAFVEWDEKQAGDYLVKEAIFPSVHGMKLVHQSAQSKSYAGPLGTRLLKEFTAIYETQKSGTHSLGKVEVVYADKSAPNDFKKMVSNEIEVVLPNQKIRFGLLMFGIISAVGLIGGFFYRRFQIQQKKRLDQALTPGEIALNSLNESMKFIYESNPRGYYKSLEKIMTQYESEVSFSESHDDFIELKNEVSRLREKTGYAGVRTDWDQDKKFHERVKAYFDSQRNDT